MSGWIATIVIGLIAGWLAEQIMKRDMSIWMNLGVGIAGAFVGKLILFFVPFVGASGGLIWSILVATMGAVVLLWVVAIVTKKETA